MISCNIYIFLIYPSTLQPNPKILLNFPYVLSLVTFKLTIKTSLYIFRLDFHRLQNPPSF